MTAERKAELRREITAYGNLSGSLASETLDALDAAEAEIERLTGQLDCTEARKDAARECAAIADAQKQEWIRPSEGLKPLPECAHACHLVAMKIRERFGLETK